eukprot:TRINITY_DN762_c0_g1_i1.p2 TRINITY_DN762_c0_g1~~TRINITY_DN762_c0_g1_i1.p2  ORF type:complete len:129 (+),score=13.01 TRINITY_DN762_c0_g1_i1:36-422(+)
MQSKRGKINQKMQLVSLLVFALLAFVLVDAKAKGHKKAAKKYEFVDNDFDSINDYDEGYEADTYGVAYFFRYSGQEAPSQWQMTDDEEDLEFSDYYDDDSEDDRWVDYEDEGYNRHHKSHNRRGHRHH